MEQGELCGQEGQKDYFLLSDMLYSKDIGQVNRLYIQVREHPAAVRLVLLVRPRQVSCIMLLWIRAGGQKLLESDQELMCFLEFISFLLCHYI